MKKTTHKRIHDVIESQASFSSKDLIQVIECEYSDSDSENEIHGDPAPIPIVSTVSHPNPFTSPHASLPDRPPMNRQRFSSVSSSNVLAVETHKHEPLRIFTKERDPTDHCQEPLKYKTPLLLVPNSPPRTLTRISRSQSMANFSSWERLYPSSPFSEGQKEKKPVTAPRKFTLSKTRFSKDYSSDEIEMTIEKEAEKQKMEGDFTTNFSMNQLFERISDGTYLQPYGACQNEQSQLNFLRIKTPSCYSYFTIFLQTHLLYVSSEELLQLFIYKFKKLSSRITSDTVPFSSMPSLSREMMEGGGKVLPPSSFSFQKNLGIAMLIWVKEYPNLFVTNKELLKQLYSFLDNHIKFNFYDIYLHINFGLYSYALEPRSKANFDINPLTSHAIYPINILLTEKKRTNYMNRLKKYTHAFTGKEGVRFLSERYNIPETQVSEIFQQLVDNGLIVPVEKSLRFPEISFRSDNTVYFVIKKTRFSQKPSVLFTPPENSSPCPIPHKYMDLSHFHPKELARQLTLFEHDLIQKITLSELLKPEFYNNPKLAENIVAYSNHFNSMTKFIESEISYNINQKKRDWTVKYFAEIANQFIKLRNFNGVFEIWYAVSMLSTKNKSLDLGIFKKIEDICDMKLNYNKYRLLLAKEPLPKLCFFGIHLKDLYIFNEIPSFSDSTSVKLNIADRKINLEKINKVHDFIKMFTDIQDTPFPLNPCPEIKNYISINTQIQNQVFFIL